VIRWQLTLLWPLVATVLILSAFALYVFAHSERLYRLKLALIPAVLAAAVASFMWFGSRLGYAFPAGLPQSFEYIAHKVILVDNRKAWLDVLVVSRKPLERDARLHRMPWTKELEDALKGAQEIKKQGGQVDMEQGGGDEYPQWVPKRVQPQQEMPKDPIPERQSEPDLLAPDGGRI
jgi:hypothetical protein